MSGMAAAADRLELAIARRETILLYGDYDVDGTTAVVLLKTAIEMLAGADGAKVRFHVPHRLREGYGMQSSVLEAAAADGVASGHQRRHRHASIRRSQKPRADSAWI